MCEAIPSLARLPQEILEKCVLLLDPEDISACLQTCKAVRCLGQDDLFWKKIWMDTFDKPTLTTKQEEADFGLYSERLKGVISATHAIEHKRAADQDLAKILDLLYYSRRAYSGCPHLTRNVAYLQRLFNQDDVQDYHITSRRMLALHDETASFAPDIANPSLLRSQVSARWACHLGLSAGQVYLTQERAAARSRVYDLTNYTFSTAFGPFQPAANADDAGQIVNWIHVEAIVKVALANLISLYADQMSLEEMTQLLPIGLHFARPYTMPKMPSSTPAGDWAGVTGKWRRLVSFLDYRDLFSYQMRRMHGVNSLIPSDEAIRLLSMNLAITKIGSEEDAKDSRYPTLYFAGRSEHGTPNESSIRGHVCRIKDGSVRWSMISTYGGEDRWSSIGVQVGGVQSGLGVYGIWSGKDHDRTDPAGPFLLWKRRHADQDMDSVFV